MLTQGIGRGMFGCVMLVYVCTQTSWASMTYGCVAVHHNIGDKH